MANEIRRLYNFQGGLVDDDPLTAGATTLNSAGLGNLPAVGSTEHVPITFDPDGLEGAPFVKWITAHTATATSATIEATAREGTARQVSKGIPWVLAATQHDFFTARVSQGPNGATRASSTYGPLSTAWTVTVPVLTGQVVDLSAQIALSCANDEVLYVAFRRGSTTIYENVHYTHAPNLRTNNLHHFWRDDTPGTGDVIYEVYVASNGGGTVTLRNGATLDTTVEMSQGKSILRAVARAG